MLAIQKPRVCIGAFTIVTHAMPPRRNPERLFSPYQITPNRYKVKIF